MKTSNEYIYAIENVKPIFRWVVNKYGHKEPSLLTKDILVSLYNDFCENCFNHIHFAEKHGFPIEYCQKVILAGKYFSNK
jgi:hypothetical protein